MDPATLVGTAWTLAELDGEPVLDGRAPTLAFPEPGRAAGHTGCNRFFGSVTVIGDSISFGQTGSTRMACPEPVMAQEQRYLRALARAERFTREAERLVIHLKDSTEPLRLEPAG